MAPSRQRTPATLCSTSTTTARCCPSSWTRARTGRTWPASQRRTTRRTPASTALRQVPAAVPFGTCPCAVASRLQPGVRHDTSMLSCECVSPENQEFRSLRFHSCLATLTPVDEPMMNPCAGRRPDHLLQDRRQPAGQHGDHDRAHASPDSRPGPQNGPHQHELRGGE